MHPSGLAVWIGMMAIIAGVIQTIAGLVRYRSTRVQLDEGKF